MYQIDQKKESEEAGRIRFRLEGGLNSEQLDRIYIETLDVLHKIGIEVDHQESLERLHGCKGVSVDRTRVRLAPDLVDAYIEGRRSKKPPPEPPDRIKLTGPWNCFNIEDMQTGEVRRSTAKDVDEMFRLLYVTTGGHISPVYPTDVPNPLQLLYLEKKAVELTDSTGSRMEFSDPRILEFAIAMYKAAGRKYVCHVQFPISPLRLNPGALKTILGYMDRTDIELHPVAGPIPQAGLTAPLFVPAALVQAMAESVGAALILDLITGGSIPVQPGPRIDLFDMRYMTTLYASPEHILYQLILRQVIDRFFGAPKDNHYLNCNAKRCDAQSMLERTAWIVTLALAGYRNFYMGAGQLSMDEVFSPAQFVLDFEIIRFAEHIIRGIEYKDEPGLSVRTIADVGPGGEFLTHATTIEGLGKHFESHLMPNTSVGQWRLMGEPDIRRKAGEEAQRLIASYNRSCPPGLSAKLDDIWKEAEKRFLRK